MTNTQLRNRYQGMRTYNPFLLLLVLLAEFLIVLIVSGVYGFVKEYWQNFAEFGAAAREYVAFVRDWWDVEE